jgi:hypothetical protein
MSWSWSELVEAPRHALRDHCSAAISPTDNNTPPPALYKALQALDAICDDTSLALKLIQAELLNQPHQADIPLSQIMGVLVCAAVCFKNQPTFWTQLIKSLNTIIQDMLSQQPLPSNNNQSEAKSAKSSPVKLEEFENITKNVQEMQNKPNAEITPSKPVPVGFQRLAAAGISLPFMKPLELFPAAQSQNSSNSSTSNVSKPVSPPLPTPNPTPPVQTSTPAPPSAPAAPLPPPPPPPPIGAQSALMGIGFSAMSFSIMKSTGMLDPNFKNPIPPPCPSNPFASMLVKTKSLRRIYWEKLRDQIISVDSYWNKVNVSQVILEEKALESLFEIKQKRKSAASDDDSSSDIDTPSKPAKKMFEKVSLLDEKKSRQIDLLMRKLKFGPEEVRTHILQVNERVITVELLSLLVKCLPTEEEVKKVVSYSGDFNLLGDAEKVVHVLSTVPMLTIRLEVWLFKCTFTDLIEEARYQLESVKKALACVRESESFMKLLAHLLALGNFLNQGTRDGNARGFKLSSLVRFCDSKSADGTIYLLDYFVDWVSRTSPMVNDFLVEFKSVEVVANISQEMLEKSVTTLKERCAVAEELFEQIDDSDVCGDDDKFVSLLEDFLQFAPVQVQKTEEDLRLLLSDFKQLAKSFGHVNMEESFSWNDFFADLMTFSESYHKALERYRKKVAERQKAARSTAKLGSARKVPPPLSRSLSDGNCLRRDINDLKSPEDVLKVVKSKRRAKESVN